MLAEKLPIKREWEFWDDDDVTITFSMKDTGVLIPLTGCTAFSQIRDSASDAGVLISDGQVSITSDIITTVFPRADLVGLVGSTVYGDLRLITVDTKHITLLSFSALMNSTISREVAP